MSDIFSANILIIFVSYLTFIKSLMRIRSINYIVKIIANIIYAYAFYLCGAISGTLTYLLFAAYVFVLWFNINKSILPKILFTGAISYFIYFTKDFNIINIFPYIVFLIHIWPKVYIKNNFVQNILRITEKILIIIYAYKYQLYTLAILEIMNISFDYLSRIFQGLIKWTDKRTEVIK